MSEKTPNSSQLYQALKQSAPDRADDLVAKFNDAKTLVGDALSGKKKEAARQANNQLSLIAKTIVDNSAESRADLVDAFSQELDNITSYFGGVTPGGPIYPEAPVVTVKRPDIKVEKEQPIGFAQRYKESPLQEIVDQMSDQQKKEVFRQLLEESHDGIEISKEKQMRLEQLSAIVTALESIKSNIKESRTWGEWWKQAGEFEGTTNVGVLRLSDLIERMKQFAIPAIVQDGMTLEQVFLKYNTEFGDEVKDMLRSFDETKEFFDKYDRLKDVTNEKDKIAYYGSLIKFLRDRQDYATAQVLMQELMDAEFEMARGFMDLDLRNELYDKASVKIDKRMTVAVREQYRKKGLNNAQIQGVRDEIVSMETMKMENDYIAEHLLIGGGDDRTEGTMQAMVRDQNEGIWEQYKDMLNPKGEFFNLKDESWDTIVEELIISAPLIILSGGVAGIVTKGLSAGAMELLHGTRLAAGFMRLAEGGRVARFVHRTGKLGGRATALLTEGSLFELTHTGLQGKLLDDQKDWVKSILWTSTTLGVFKGAGKIGKEGTDIFNSFLKEALPKIGDKKLVQLMNQLIIQGHTEVLAMLMVGTVQHMSAGEFDEFYENFGDQVFHAYVAIGALHIAGKAIVTPMGKIFTPDGGGKGPKNGISEAGKTNRAEARKGKTEAGVDEAAKKKPSEVDCAIETGGSVAVEMKSLADLVDALDLLESKGFSFEITKSGETIARKGAKEIYLREAFDSSTLGKGLKESAAKLRSVLQKFPKLKRKFEDLQKQATDIVTELTRLNEKGPLNSRTREVFRLRLAALGTALMALMYTTDARAAGIKDLLKPFYESFIEGAKSLKDNVVLGLSAILGLYIIWGTAKNFATFGKILGPIVGVPRARYILWRLNGAARTGGRITTEGGIGTRLRNRPGIRAGDQAARDAGTNLQNALNAMHGGRQIAQSIRERRYELGPLAEFADTLTETGDRILAILNLGRVWTPAENAEFNNLIRDFNRQAADLPNRLANVAVTKVSLVEIGNLVGYTMLLSFACWWYFSGDDKKKKKKVKKDDGDTETMGPPPDVTPIPAPSPTGGGGGGADESGGGAAAPPTEPAAPPAEPPEPSAEPAPTEPPPSDTTGRKKIKFYGR